MAAMLYPTRRVLAVCGDGGFMMNSQELETAVRLELNLVVLILQDNAYGMIRWKQAADGYPDFGMSFGNPDFVVYAKSYGINGARWRAPMAWCRHWKPPLRRAAFNSSPLRSTIRRICGSWSTSCVPTPRRTVSNHDRGRGHAMADNALVPIAEITQIRLCCVAGVVPVMNRPGAKRSPRRWRVERSEQDRPQSEGRLQHLPFV